MKRLAETLAIGGLLLTLTLCAPSFAQGKGAGKGWGAQGQPCPYGLNQPNPNAGGWWTRVSPTDPKQKAFVEEVSKLHTRIREEQLALRELEAAKANPETIAAKQAAIDALRVKLHDLQYNNRELKQQIMIQNGGGRGRGMCLRQGTGPQGQAGPGKGMGPRSSSGPQGRMGPGRGMGRGMRPGCPFAGTGTASPNVK